MFPSFIFKFKAQRYDFFWIKSIGNHTKNRHFSPFKTPYQIIQFDKRSHKPLILPNKINNISDISKKCRIFANLIIWIRMPKYNKGKKDI